MRFFVGDQGRTRAALVTVVVALALATAAWSEPSAVPGTGQVSASGERPLRRLAADAKLVALVDVVRSESHDEDRLQVHRLRVVRVLRGTDEVPEPGVVDIRGSLSRRPLLTAGERAVVLLRPAPPLSYLTQHLGADPYFETVGGRDGVVLVASDEETAAVERALTEGTSIASLTGDAATAAVRALAFRELASGSPRLAADALVELRGLGRIAQPTRPEVEALARALAERAVDPAVRVGLLRFIAEQDDRGVAPALANAVADTPAVLEALLSARAALGVVSGRAQLAEHLDSSDPAIRAAAVRALARLRDPAAISEVGRYATDDPDLDVRIAAVEALGATKQPAAVPILVRTFESSEHRLMQRSARALLEIDGPAADDALVDLSLKGGSPLVRTYAASLVLAAHGREHPAVRRIETSNPPPEVRRLFEEGWRVHD